MKTSKTVNGVKTTFMLDGYNVIEQTDGTTTLHFFYDSNGEIIGFRYNENDYFYVKNAMSDIIAITDSNKNIVAEYRYEPWGKVLDEDDLTVIGNLNPFRYRSYYYDSDIEMYYLQSRYYDPEVCRFINSDDVNFIGFAGTVGSYNAFAYCENNPVNGWDPVGTLRFRTTVVAFSLDCLFTILGPSFKYGYDLVGATLKLIARKYGYKSFANKLLYSVVPKFRGLFSKFFTTIRTAIWRATGSFLSNTTNNFFVHIGKYISKLYDKGRYYTIYQYIATFLSAGSLVAAFMAWASTGNWLSNYIYL